MGEEEPQVSLDAFISQETFLFFEHLKAAIEKYRSEGQLPHSVFKAVAVKDLLKAGGKKRAAGGKRKPTAFNLYVKEKLEEMKKADGGEGDHSERFKTVASQWKSVSDEVKKYYTEKSQAAAKEDGEAPAEGGDEPKTKTPKKKKTSD